MTVLQRISLLILLIIGFLSGCDDFSLTDEFRLDEIDSDQYDPEPVPELVFIVSQDTLTRYQWVSCSVSGGSGDYTFSVEGIDLGYSGISVGELNETGFVAGDSIGLIRLTVTDEAGSSTSSDVTVLPEAPEEFTAYEDESDKSGVSWTYSDTVGIQGFKIYRGESINDCPLWQEAGNTSTSYVGEADPFGRYFFYITAFSGTYESAASGPVELDMDPG